MPIIKRQTMVFIISPDDLNLYYEKVKGFFSHSDALQDLCVKHNIFYEDSTIANIDKLNEAIPCNLAKNGYIVVKTLGGLRTAVFYLPSTISEQQLYLLNMYHDTFAQYTQITASIVDGDSISEEQNYFSFDKLYEDLENIYQKKWCL